MSSSDFDQASELLHRTVESLRAGTPVDFEALRGPLAELLEDSAGGDDGGVVNPYAEAVARALLDRSA